MRFTPVGGHEIVASRMPKAEAVLILSLATLIACAGGPSPPSSSEAPAADVGETVARMQWEWVRALERGDVAALEQLLAPDFVTTAADGNVLNRTEELAPVRTGEVKFEKAALEDLRVRVFGDSAVVTGIGVFAGTVRGRRFEGRERFTDIWVKRDGRWVAVASHNSRLTSAPAPKPTPASAALDRAEWAGRVRAEMLHAWRAYERHAWGHDELKPLSRAPRDWHSGTLLMTPVDALDTLILMALKDEAERAKALILEKLSFDQDIEVKNFEITIRVLGGLLSAFQMTGDARFLRLAEDLGNRLLPSFGSPTGMPYMYVNLKTGKTRGARTNPAEIGTLILEFGTLSRLTKKPLFYEKAKNALRGLYDRRSKLGLVGEEIDVETGQWVGTASHVGGGIDSYYEYLLKCSRLFGDRDCEAMWQESLRALNTHLADEAPTGLWYGQVDLATGQRTATEFGALHAFLPSVLALGGDLDRAKRLQDSCLKMWTLHGIEPEVLDYRAMRVTHPGYPLRPEIIESAYYLHRYTKDPRYLEMGRTFLEGLIAHCRTEDGYTTLKNVVTKEKGDLMPSYFLAETLKYLYLLFAPDETLDLERVVFNTEAHPLRRTW